MDSMTPEHLDLHRQLADQFHDLCSTTDAAETLRAGERVDQTLREIEERRATSGGR